MWIDDAERAVDLHRSASAPFAEGTSLAAHPVFRHNTNVAAVCANPTCLALIAVEGNAGDEASSVATFALCNRLVGALDAGANDTVAAVGDAIALAHTQISTELSGSDAKDLGLATRTPIQGIGAEALVALLTHNSVRVMTVGLGRAWVFRAGKWFGVGAPRSLGDIMAPNSAGVEASFLKSLPSRVVGLGGAPTATVEAAPILDGDYVLAVVGGVASAVEALLSTGWQPHAGDLDQSCASLAQGVARLRGRAVPIALALAQQTRPSRPVPG